MPPCAQLERQQEELVAFTALQEARPTTSKVDYERRLKDAGFSSSADLDDYLKKLNKSLTRARNRELGIEEENKVRWPPARTPSLPSLARLLARPSDAPAPLLSHSSACRRRPRSRSSTSPTTSSTRRTSRRSGGRSS